MQLIPLSEVAKTRADIVAVPGAISLPFFSGIPWVEIAAFLAAVYSVLRILEWAIGRVIRLVRWWKNPERRP